MYSESTSPTLRGVHSNAGHQHHLSAGGAPSSAMLKGSFNAGVNPFGTGAVCSFDEPHTPQHLHHVNSSVSIASPLGGGGVSANPAAASMAAVEKPYSLQDGGTAMVMLQRSRLKNYTTTAVVAFFVLLTMVVLMIRRSVPSDVVSADARRFTGASNAIAGPTVDPQYLPGPPLKQRRAGGGEEADTTSSSSSAVALKAQKAPVSLRLTDFLAASSAGAKASMRVVPLTAAYRKQLVARLTAQKKRESQKAESNSDILPSERREFPLSFLYDTNTRQSVLHRWDATKVLEMRYLSEAVPTTTNTTKAGAGGGAGAVHAGAAYGGGDGAEFRPIALLHEDETLVLPSQVKRVVVEVGTNQSPEFGRAFDKNNDINATTAASEDAAPAASSSAVSKLSDILYILFEPQPLPYDTAKRRFGLQSNLVFIPAAVGPGLARVAPLTISSESACSSLFGVNGEAKVMGDHPCTKTAGSVDVVVMPLWLIFNVLVPSLPASVVLIDAQGFDLSVASSLRAPAGLLSGTGVLPADPVIPAATNLPTHVIVECQDTTEKGRLLTNGSASCADAIYCMPRYFDKKGRATAVEGLSLPAVVTAAGGRAGAADAVDDSGYYTLQGCTMQNPHLAEHNCVFSISKTSEDVWRKATDGSGSASSSSRLYNHTDYGLSEAFAGTGRTFRGRLLSECPV